MTDSRTHPRPAEFIALVAAVMATGALGIDSMLPALQAIGRGLGVADGNAHQWIVTAYVLGMGAAQLAWGPLSDRFGRRPTLLAALGLYALCSAAAAFAPGFGALLALRALQGAAAAGARVISTSIVRDRFEGPQLARVMSLAFMVFIATPVIAPSLGQLVLLTWEWHAVFALLAGGGVIVAAWVALRLPETLPLARRRPLEWAGTAQAVRLVLRQRQSLGYTLAATIASVPMMAFLNSAPQLFDQTYGAGAQFPLIFAVIAAALAAASLLNARIVMRMGMQRVSHAALLGFIAVSALHLALLLGGAGTLASFVVLQALALFCFGLLTSNFGAMAMDPMGALAGTAASVQGFISTLGSALLGFALSQRFDGSALPLVAGSLLCAVLTLAVVAVVERGRLFGAAATAVPARPV